MAPQSLQSLLGSFLVALLANTRTASAADCYGLSSDCGLFAIGDQAAWAARADYCGNDHWKSSHCFKTNGVVITFTTPGSNNQQSCWDALENIIQQCERGNAYSGTYDYGGEEYSMTFCSVSHC